MRRPPRSTLFPYRRSSDLEMELKVHEAKEKAAKDATVSETALEAQINLDLIVKQYREQIAAQEQVIEGFKARSPNRSEEHTSELQSHVNLVCRLLLVKKIL